MGIPSEVPLAVPTLGSRARFAPSKSLPSLAPVPAPEPPLLQQVASGQPDAVQLCVQRYQGLVYTLARGFFADPAEVEDAVQDVFIDLWKNASRFDPSRGKETTFVGVLARRRLIDRLRKKTRRPDSAPMELEPVAEQASVDQQLSVNEDAQAAREVLATLPPQQREAIELTVLHGLTHQEVSQKLEIPLGTVKAHVRRGLQRLRDRLRATHPSLGELA